MFTFSRNRRVREKLLNYLETAIQAANCFRDGMGHCRAGRQEALAEAAALIHRHESQCDRIRRLIERELFEKSLLPEFREDILLLLEELDLVVNQLEDVLRQMVLQRLILPAEYRDAYQELAMLSHDACRVLFEQAVTAMENDAHVQELEDRVKMLEGSVDRCEQALVERLFASDLGLAEKLWYRELVSMTAAVSDLAEDVANRITIFRVKREY